ncbi:TetR-like C-terminal domain-containing protein, partial [Streptomyces sp. NPDC048352]|uniref:TetR-like C-terminal domain-containing protein n=1 Tax=Streptomyces sp. NPDC048352 TaxID=3154718 RepID=UPI003437E19C
MDAAWAAAPADDPAGRIRAWAHALRDWALANPEGFRLVYGAPVPRYQAPAGGAAPEAAGRVCLGRRLPVVRLRGPAPGQGPSRVPRP